MPQRKMNPTRPRTDRVAGIGGNDVRKFRHKDYKVILLRTFIVGMAKITSMRINSVASR